MFEFYVALLILYLILLIILIFIKIKEKIKILRIVYLVSIPLFFLILYNVYYELVLNQKLINYFKI